MLQEFTLAGVTYIQTPIIKSVYIDANIGYNGPIT